MERAVRRATEERMNPRASEEDHASSEKVGPTAGSAVEQPVYVKPAANAYAVEQPLISVEAQVKALRQQGRRGRHRAPGGFFSRRG